MKKVLFILLFIVMFFNINVVDADDICSDEELAREKEIANNISYNYEFIGDKDNTVGYQTYNVSFDGVTSDVYISDPTYKYKFYNNGEILKIDSGKWNFIVFSKNCAERILRTIQINLPKFNEYSESVECLNKKISKIKYCDPWYSGDITSEEFDKVISDYNLAIQNSNKSVSDKIMDILKKYYYIFIPSLLLILVILWVVIWIRHNKNILE